MTEFHKWADSIIELTGPIADTSSLKWALSMSVLHAPEAAAYLPKMYFVRRLIKGAANQVVSQAVQDLKAAQKAAAEARAEAEQQQVEVTTSQKEVVTASGTEKV